jgi:uncharacterized membrane protein
LKKNQQIEKRAWQSLQVRLRKFLFSWNMKGHLPLLLMILVYAFVFSYATVTRLYALKTYAYDLGNYNQALYTTLRGYGFLYYTADLPVTNGSMMGVHFSPILLMILPIYALYPAPANLLVLKSFVLALGAVPVYQLARFVLKTKKWGFLFAAVYLLNPVVQGINWFDFHPEAFFLTFFLFTLYYGLKGSWSKYLLFSILALTTTEYSAILLVLESIYLLWAHAEETKNSLKSLKHLELRNINARFKYPLTTVILAIVWFFIGLLVISFFSPGNPMVGGGATQWKTLGADGTLSVPLRVLISPQSALAALSVDWPIKLAYLAILFGSTAFLSFLSPKCLIITLPWFMVALLSDYSAFYYIGNQYPVFLLPPIIVASIVGAERFLEFASKKNIHFDHKKMLAISLLIATLLFSFLSSPLYGLHLGEWPDLTYGLDQITEHDRIVMQILSYIPPDASVITQQNIFPLLSSRTNSFVIPLGSFYPLGSDFNTTLSLWLQKSDFVLVDLNTSIFETYLVYGFIKDDFGVYASKDGVILLKRNYSGNPDPFVPYHVSLDYTNLALDDWEKIKDPIFQGNNVLHNLPQATTNKPDHFPSGYVSPGEYEATFKLRFANNPSSKIANISVLGLQPVLTITPSGNESTGHKFLFNFTYSTDSTIVYSSTELLRSDFPEVYDYEEFRLYFSLKVPGALEYKSAIVPSNDVDIYLDRIEVTQLTAFP